MFKVKVEILEPVGTLKTGYGKRDGKPYAMAEQPAAVHIEGMPYPVVGVVSVRTENVRVEEGIIKCSVEWRAKGFYETFVKVESDRYGKLSANLLDRSLSPIKADPAPMRKAA